MTEEDLNEFFSPSSRVKEVRILRERGTARPRVCILNLNFWIPSMNICDANPVVSECSSVV